MYDRSRAFGSERKFHGVAHFARRGIILRFVRPSNEALGSRSVSFGHDRIGRCKRSTRAFLTVGRKRKKERRIVGNALTGEEGVRKKHETCVCV